MAGHSTSMKRVRRRSADLPAAAAVVAAASNAGKLIPGRGGCQAVPFVVCPSCTEASTLYRSFDGFGDFRKDSLQARRIPVRQRGRPPQQETLDLIAADAPQDFQLFFRFHSLYHHLLTDTVSERNHPLDQRLGGAVYSQVRHKAAVDLEGVDRQ